ncbi:MAG: sensor histidine kinase [Fluviicola sp.]
MKFLCSVTLIVLLAHSLQGQELYGKYLNHEQGLLSNECYDINYDENGYLIVGTQYGPMKYDGEKFLPICTNLPLGRRVMYDFERSPQGTVYLLNSKNELFKLQNDKAIYIGPKNRLKFPDSDLTFLKLYYTPKGLYISTFSQYLKYSFQTQRIEYPPPYTKNLFRFRYQENAEFPFVKLSGKLITNRKVQFEFPESRQQLDYMNIMVTDSREDEIKIGKTTYLIICMKLFKKKDHRITPMNFSRILFIEYFHDRIWLCTIEGLIELDKEGNFIHHHFKGELVGGVAPLKSGGIAVSLNKKGVFISSNINNRIYSDIIPTASATINGINLVGSAKGDIFKYSDSKLEKITQVESFNTDTKRFVHDVICKFFRRNNETVVISGYGTSIFSTDFKKVKTIQDNRNSIFGTFLYNENIYFIHRTVIYKIAWKNLNTIPYPYDKKSITIPSVRSYAWLNDSTILLGNNTGLISYNLKSAHYSRLDIFKKELRVNAINVIGKNKLLVCTHFDGAYIIQNNKIILRLTIPCTTISSALVYQNHLIIRGNDGIYIKSLHQPEHSVWRKFFSGETENIFTLDNSLLISYQKNLIIKKLSDYKLVYKPKIVLNKFQLGGTGMKTFPHLIPSNKSISVDLDILQFDANKLDLYYILKGENTISQQVEGTKINFDALKSGEYELKIHPVIDGKIQFNNSKTFRFTMEETFWESTAFFIILGVLLLSIIFSIFLIVNLRRKRRSAERAALESKLNEYKLLAVKAQVNPHFLSNGLAAIQALILKGNNDLAAQYLAKFSFLMRKILYYSETQFISVNQELQLIDAYLELELLRFRNRFNIQKEIHLSEQELNEFQFPSLLLQPILENAIWHGLKFQENNPELHISFKINGNQELLVEISDNGPGFSSSDKSEEHLSKGNQLITDRIDSLNEQFQSKVADIKISSSDSGTTVAFVFAPQLYQSKMS